MSEFEKWFTTYRPSLDTSAIEVEFIFEAGAQSKQADIDELQKKNDDLCALVSYDTEQMEELHNRIDEYREVAESMEDSYMREKAKVDELRKRIEKTDSLIMSFGDSIDVPLRNSLIDAIRGLEDL